MSSLSLSVFFDHLSPQALASFPELWRQFEVGQVVGVEMAELCTKLAEVE